MGREIKRGPLDFNWPLEQVWSGYKNPHDLSTECPACGGSGNSPEAQRMYDQWYGRAPFTPTQPWSPTDAAVLEQARRQVERRPEFYGRGEWSVVIEARRLAEFFNSLAMHHVDAEDVAALVAAGRLMDLTHDWALGVGRTPKNPPHYPTVREVNEWSLRGFGHDACNLGIVLEARCKRAGVPYLCAECDGEGRLWPSPEAKQRYEDWTPTEPPAGDGYQLWETVSEGSPISPVFGTPEELADWLVTNPGNDPGTTRAQWLKFILGPGWAPSLVMDEHGVRSGVEAVQ